MTNILVQRNVSTKQANRLLAATQLNIIAVNRGKSIVLYVGCNKEDLTRLCAKVDNLEIIDILEQLFKLLTQNMNIRVLSVTIFEKDIAKAEQLFKSRTCSIN